MIGQSDLVITIDGVNEVFRLMGIGPQVIKLLCWTFVAEKMGLDLVQLSCLVLAFHKLEQLPIATIVGLHIWLFRHEIPDILVAFRSNGPDSVDCEIAAISGRYDVVSVKIIRQQVHAMHVSRHTYIR